MSLENDWFKEDEDDIFIGSPKSKFFDIARTASSEIVENEIDTIFGKYAIMEMLLSENKDVNFDLDKQLERFMFENKDKVNTMKKGLYLEFTGLILSKLDS